MFSGCSHVAACRFACPPVVATPSFPSRQTLIFSSKAHSDAQKSRSYSRIIVFFVAQTTKNTIILEGFQRITGDPSRGRTHFRRGGPLPLEDYSVFTNGARTANQRKGTPYLKNTHILEENRMPRQVPSWSRDSRGTVAGLSRESREIVAGPSRDSRGTVAGRSRDRREAVVG